jgi:hypothetical protein
MAETLRGSGRCAPSARPRRGQAPGIALGSLDLLDPQRKFEIIDITAKLIAT